MLLCCLPAGARRQMSSRQTSVSPSQQRLVKHSVLKYLSIQWLRELLKYRVRKCHLINCEKEGRRSTCSFFFAVLKPGMSKCLEKFSRTSVIVLLLSWIVLYGMIDWRVFFLFCSPNRDHSVQSVRRQVEWCPLWRDHLRRLQRLLSTLAEFGRGELSVPPTEKLRGWSG